MKVFWITLCLCLTLAGLVRVLTASSRPPGNPIVGTWRSAAPSARTLEFFADGTYHADCVTGTYRFPDDSHLVLVPGANAMFSSLKTIRLDGDTLTLTDVNFRLAHPAIEKLHRASD